MREEVRCDICGRKTAEYDGKTKEGAWAYMCEGCFKHYGINVKGLFTKLGTDKKEKDKMKIEVGDKIRIINMQGEPQYEGKEGTVTHIDSIGQIHGTWGGCALIPEVDDFKII